MKRKIICLAICVACLVSMLASCGSNPNVCTTHVDADKNSVCDTCSMPVVTIVEKVPTEEAIVDMIVAAIPGATLGDVLATTVEKDLLAGKFEVNENLSKAENMDDLDNANRYWSYYFITQTKGLETTEENWPTEEEWVAAGKAEADYKADGWKDDDKYTATFAIYDLLLNKDLYTFTTVEFAKDEANHVTAPDDVQLVNDFFFKVTTRVWTEEKDEEDEESTWTSELVDAYYFKNGTLFLDEAKTKKDETFYAPVFNDLRDGIIYYTVDDTMYAFNFDTYAKLGEGAKDTFVKRPTFTYATDALGIVKQGNEYFVYDLAKWIECVYSYEAPANAQTFILNNGNILVQESVILPNSAVNYDYTDGNNKYDLVHTVVDIAAKTTANLELGYYVTYVENIDGEGAEKVKNGLYVQTIVNKNLAKELFLICDDALAIIAEYNAVLPNFVDDVELIADNVFLATVVYGEGSSIRKLFNAKGEEIVTLPNSAVLYDTFILDNGKFYDFTMKLILDPLAAEKDEDDFIVGAMYDEYVILYKGNDTYYWNATLAAPKMIVDATNVEMVPSESDATVLVPTEPNPLKIQYLETAYEEYYIVCTTTTTTTKVEGEADKVEVVTEYVLYNAQGTEIFKSEDYIEVDCMTVEDEGVWMIMADDGIYFQK